MPLKHHLISEPRPQKPRPERALFALLLSIFVHLLGIITFGYLGWLLLKPVVHPPETIAFSSAIRIEKRSQPRIHPNQPLRRVMTPAKPMIPQKTAVKPVPAKHELSVRRPNASPQPRENASPHPSSLAVRLAREQAILARESARLQASNNPLADVRNAKPPTALKHTMFDTSGQDRENFEAYLLPLQHWRSGSLSCYYVQYNAQFSTGGSERGTIPWPVCYPQSHDAIAIADAISAKTGRSVPLPIPVPQPSYVLPSGTYLTPLLEDIFRQRP